MKDKGGTYQTKPRRGVTSATSIAVVKLARTMSDRRLAGLGGSLLQKRSAAWWQESVPFGIYAVPGAILPAASSETIQIPKHVTTAQG